MSASLSPSACVAPCLARWPWRLAVAAYACCFLFYALGLVTHGAPGLVQPLLALALSALCLLGMLCLVAAAVLALVGLRKRDVVNAAVLLVTLPPLLLHVWLAAR